MFLGSKGRRTLAERSVLDRPRACRIRRPSQETPLVCRGPSPRYRALRIGFSSWAARSPLNGIARSSHTSYPDLVLNRRLALASTMAVAETCIPASLVILELLPPETGAGLILTHQTAYFQGLSQWRLPQRNPPVSPGWSTGFANGVRSGNVPWTGLDLCQSGRTSRVPSIGVVLKSMIDC